jgi:hypothetical protein
VKNNLAAVLSIAEQTVSGADSLNAFAEAFTGRVRSMAVAHELLASSSWEGADLQKMLERQRKDFLHFDPVWFQLHIFGKPSDEGDDQLVPATLLLGKLSQTLQPVPAHAQFFLHLPQSRLPWSFPGFHPPAWKAHFTGASTQMSSAKLEHDFHALPIPAERHDDRRAEKRIVQIPPRRQQGFP